MNCRLSKCRNGRRKAARRRGADYGEEFDRMIEQVDALRPGEAAEWKRLMHSMWWPGCGWIEALNLTWDREEKLRIILAGEDSLLHIPADCQKSNQDSICPVAPEFVTFLEETPANERHGYVFNLPFRRKDTVSKTICSFGKAAGIKVNTDPRTGKVKYATRMTCGGHSASAGNTGLCPPCCKS